MSAFYGVVRASSRLLLSPYFPLRREGLEHVPREGPLVLAGNHVSYLDPAMLGSACPRSVHFLMNGNVWKSPAMNWFYRGMQAIPVGLPERSVREPIAAALGVLARGGAVGIFPEGRRVAAGSPSAALPGVALIARRSGAPVVPVGISGTEKAMPKGRALPEPAPVRVRFGAPLDVDAAPGGRRDRDRAFAEALMERIRVLAGPAS